MNGDSQAAPVIISPDQFPPRTWDAESPGPTASPKPQDGYFQCGFCKKNYTRADHLIRHVRSHTREKPYACHVCNKGFARPDLMKRHAAAHDIRREGTRKRRMSMVKNVRVSKACKTCAASKLKCDEDKPCRRCREKDVICEWVQDTQDISMTSPSREQSEEQGLEYQDPGTPYVLQDTLQETVGSQPSSPHINADPPRIQPQPCVTVTDAPMSNYRLAAPLPPEANSDFIPVAYDGGSTKYPAAVTSAAYAAHHSTVSHVSPTDQESGIFSIDGTFFPDFIPDSLIPSLVQSNEHDAVLSHTHDFTHFSRFNYNLPLDFDLTDVDYGLIDFFNANGVNQTIDSNAEPAEDGDSGIALGAEAFHRSSFSAWKPDHRDHAFADQENLSVPKLIDSPQSSIDSGGPVLCEHLSPSSRDLLFGMVLNTSQRSNSNSNMTGIMKSFPSTELLDSLIQDYFRFQRHQISSWIHCPTFQPNSEGPEILAALTAAGATLSPISTIRKLGYALMEVARLRLPSMSELDNSTTRDLRFSQTFALVISIGLWSGNRRKTEIAESSTQHIVTMLRRAFRFRRSAYPAIVPTTTDSGADLEKKWRDWVEQESFKRLVYHIFVHDAQAAMTLNINPLISYGDLELPFPLPRQLWEAKSAVEWKEIYISLGPVSTERLPSLTDSLHDMSQLNTFQQRIDSHAAAFILLHGIAALVHEYHQLKFISKRQSKHWHALVINSRHQELVEALQHFRMVCSGWQDPPRPEIKLVSEIISMFLYMSLEELQLFAGKEDKKEARRVYHSALEWIDNLDSRRAIWHAGQGVRAAKAMPPLSLRGFFAISVYHAGLAFWSYSVVSKTKQRSSTGSMPNPVTGSQSVPVFLDGEDTPDVQKFIALKCGYPVLQGMQGLSLVADTSLTMHLIQDVLRRDTPADALPPLVLSLCQLMRDLGNAAGGQGIPGSSM